MKTKTSFHRVNGIYVPCFAERYQPGLYLFANRLPAFLSSATTPEANLTGVSVATANTNVAHFAWKGNKPTETQKHHAVLKRHSVVVSFQHLLRKVAGNVTGKQPVSLKCG